MEEEASVCNLNTIQAGYIVLSLAGATLISALTLATFLAGSPLSHLGLRPKGTDLWSWLAAYVKNPVGVLGYDAIQGALSPPLRLQCHISGFLFLLGTVCCVSSKDSPDEMNSDCVLGFPISVWTNVYVSLIVYAGANYVVHHLFPAVSMPGGARDHKIQRQPNWDDKTTSLDDTVTSKWKCLTAEDSHQDTHEKFPSRTLSGEPAGRQIWSTRNVQAVPSGDKTGEEPNENPNENVVTRLWNKVSGSSSGQNVDEDLVKKLAMGGREYFGYNPSKNPNSCDMIFRAQQIRKYLQKPGNQAPDIENKEIPTTIHEAAKKAVHFYSMLQCDDGHWAADYGGPHFLMPGMVSAWYLMGQPKEFLDEDQVELLKHYVLVHQQCDGGWGTHIESPSTMFGSTLMYVTLRLLGVPANHSACVRGREFLKSNGGALYTSSWSKLYLCLLGCMDWKGHNSVPPEMWLLPNWFPFHPGRMWCHARMVYLPMGYLYGTRYVYEKAESDETILSLRKELYCESYENIDWDKTRHLIAETDNYSPIPLVMKTLQNLLAKYENWAIFQPFKNWVRQKGLAFSMEYMDAEDLQTNYIDIGPVNKVLNMISHFQASGGDINNSKVLSHIMRVQDYLWVAEDGMKMQGYNGSQCWDTSFCIQAMYEANLLDEFPEVSRKVWGYLERTQILSTEVSQASPAYKFETNQYRNKFYRHISEGGWPFSTSAHGWPISDCTSEGLKGTLCLLKSKTIQDGLKDESLRKISDERLFKSINVLLTYQNEDGGWATYENNRGWGWYEQLNPSEVFGDIMIDYSYVECSMAVLTALVDFREMYPDHRVEDIQHSVDKGCAFLKSIQRSDGSWYGSWACCFCYGIWFGIEGLVKCGEPLDSPCITRACEFLLRQQRPNGGWGEDFTSCYDKDYAKEGMKAYGDDGSGVVNTAWALLALSMAKCKDVDAIRRGVQYLIKRQLPSGDWPQEGISGVFNRSVGITYTAYRNVFPIWALGRCSEVYGETLDE